jgi:solute carrier family 25 oxoglutarate transporter 11
VGEEGALFRGGLANGLKVGMLCASMTSIYDWIKENLYYTLGPHFLNRFAGTAIAVTFGTLASMPFDMIRVRLQTMRPLPNGVYPYTGVLDCLAKVIFYIWRFDNCWSRY